MYPKFEENYRASYRVIGRERERELSMVLKHTQQKSD